MSTSDSLTVCLIGTESDVALHHFASTMKGTCKLQKKAIDCRFVLVELGSPHLASDSCSVVALPYIGRMELAALAYFGYNPMRSLKECYLAPREFAADRDNAPPPTAPFAYDKVLRANTSLLFSFCKRGDETVVSSVAVDGETFPIDFIVQAQNNVAFHPRALDKALQAKEEEEEEATGVASFPLAASLKASPAVKRSFDALKEEDSNAIPRAPAGPPPPRSPVSRATTDKATTQTASNAFICGNAALFRTPDGCALSGIFVAQFIKTFRLKAMRDWFTVVTTNEKKALEYAHVCGPVHRKDPQSVLFAVNLNLDAMEEGFKKTDIVRLQIQKQGAADVVHEDSDFWFIDANSLSVFAHNDPMCRALHDHYHQFVRRRLEKGGGNGIMRDKMYEKSEVVRHSPGTDVDHWIGFLDKYPKLDAMHKGHVAHWRCSVALVSKTATKAQTDANINDLYVYDSTVHNGMAEGIITSPPRGENGFGFDTRYEPIDKSTINSPDWPQSATGRTFAEMDLDEKSKYSTRVDGILSALYWLAMHDEF